MEQVDWVGEKTVIQRQRQIEQVVVVVEEEVVEEEDWVEGGEYESF